MDLQAIRERIEREQKRGDIHLACRTAGSCTASYRQTKDLNSLDEFTDPQLRIIKELLNIFDRRIEMKNSILNHGYEN